MTALPAIFSKLVKFYGVNIASFMPRMHKKVTETILHKRLTLRGTVIRTEVLV